jgi:hypothetical protein
LRQELNDIRNKFTETASQNEELIAVNKQLLDKITTIKNYSDAVRGDHTND